MNIKFLTGYRFCLALIAYALNIQTVNGQDFSETYNILKEKYPEDQVVYNKFYEDIDIAVVADSIVVNSRHKKEIVHLGEKSNIYAKDQIYSSLFYKISNIEAGTLIPYKKKFKSIKVTEFKESFDKDSYIFYDDTKVINFIYPAITRGVHTILEYDETIKDARFVGSFLFQSYVPIVHGRYTVTVDKGIKIDIQLLNDAAKEVKVSQENMGSRIKYIYEVFNIDKVKHESGSPTIKYYTPHANLILRSFNNSKGEDVNVLSSTDDLYAWYKTFIHGLAHQENVILRAIVEELVNDAATEEDKVKKIFYWVQNNIKYIAFEEGMRGLIPHNSAYVCEKRFGDCKDMSSILVNMMHLAGIEGYFTWIGTRDIPYAYTETPTPLVDNHMIATYISGDKTYFLDATSQYSPFDLPSSMIQGKEALVAFNDSVYKIMKVPEISREQNVMNDTAYFSIDDGIVKGKGNLTLTGYAKVFNTYKLTKSNEKDVEIYLTSLLSRGSNKFSLENYTINYLKDLDQPIKIDYSFNVADYYRAVGKEIYFNMNMDKTFNGELIDKIRTLPIENEYKYSNKSVSILEIPVNYQLDHLPKDNSFSNEVFGYSIKYKPEKGKIIMQKEFFLNYLLLQPENFEKWNEVVKKLSEAYSESIILKQNDV